jgi:hypothetical protein
MSESGEGPILPMSDIEKPKPASPGETAGNKAVGKQISLKKWFEEGPGKELDLDQEQQKLLENLLNNSIQMVREGKPKGIYESCLRGELDVLGITLEDKHKKALFQRLEREKEIKEVREWRESKGDKVEDVFILGPDHEVADLVVGEGDLQNPSNASLISIKAVYVINGKVEIKNLSYYPEKKESKELSKEGLSVLGNRTLRLNGVNCRINVEGDKVVVRNATGDKEVISEAVIRGREAEVEGQKKSDSGEFVEQIAEIQRQALAEKQRKNELEIDLQSVRSKLAAARGEKSESAEKPKSGEKIKKLDRRISLTRWFKEGEGKDMGLSSDQQGALEMLLNETKMGVESGFSREKYQNHFATRLKELNLPVWLKNEPELQIRLNCEEVMADREKSSDSIQAAFLLGSETGVVDLAVGNSGDEALTVFVVNGEIQVRGIQFLKAATVHGASISYRENMTVSDNSEFVINGVRCTMVVKDNKVVVKELEGDKKVISEALIEKGFRDPSKEIPKVKKREYDRVIDLEELYQGPLKDSELTKDQREELEDWMNEAGRRVRLLDKSSAPNKQNFWNFYNRNMADFSSQFREVIGDANMQSCQKYIEKRLFNEETVSRVWSSMSPDQQKQTSIQDLRLITAKGDGGDMAMETLVPGEANDVIVGYFDGSFQVRTLNNEVKFKIDDQVHSGDEGFIPVKTGEVIELNGVQFNPVDKNGKVEVEMISTSGEEAGEGKHLQSWFKEEEWSNQTKPQQDKLKRFMLTQETKARLGQLAPNKFFESLDKFLEEEQLNITAEQKKNIDNRIIWSKEISSVLEGVSPSQRGEKSVQDVLIMASKPGEGGDLSIETVSKGTDKLVFIIGDEVYIKDVEGEQNWKVNGTRAKKDELVRVTEHSIVDLSGSRFRITKNDNQITLKRIEGDLESTVEIAQGGDLTFKSASPASSQVSSSDEVGDSAKGEAKEVDMAWLEGEENDFSETQMDGLRSLMTEACHQGRLGNIDRGDFNKQLDELNMTLGLDLVGKQKRLLSFRFQREWETGYAWRDNNFSRKAEGSSLKQVFTIGGNSLGVDVNVSETGGQAIAVFYEGDKVHIVDVSIDKGYISKNEVRLRLLRLDQVEPIDEVMVDGARVEMEKTGNELIIKVRGGKTTKVTFGRDGGLTFEEVVPTPSGKPAPGEGDGLSGSEMQSSIPVESPVDTGGSGGGSGTPPPPTSPESGERGETAKDGGRRTSLKEWLEGQGLSLEGDDAGKLEGLLAAESKEEFPASFPTMSLEVKKLGIELSEDQRIALYSKVVSENKIRRMVDELSSDHKGKVKLDEVVLIGRKSEKIVDLDLETTDTLAICVIDGELYVGNAGGGKFNIENRQVVDGEFHKVEPETQIQVLGLSEYGIGTFNGKCTMAIEGDDIVVKNDNGMEISRVRIGGGVEMENAKPSLAPPTMATSSAEGDPRQDERKISLSKWLESEGLKLPEDKQSKLEDYLNRAVESELTYCIPDVTRKIQKMGIELSEDQSEALFHRIQGEQQILKVKRNLPKELRNKVNNSQVVIMGNREKRMVDLNLPAKSERYFTTFAVVEIDGEVYMCNLENAGFNIGEEEIYTYDDKFRKVGPETLVHTTIYFEDFIVKKEGNRIMVDNIELEAERVAGEGEIALDDFFDEKIYSTEDEQKIREYMARQGKLMRVAGMLGKEYKPDYLQAEVEKVSEGLNSGLEVDEMINLNQRLKCEHKKGELWNKIADADRDGIVASDIKLIGGGLGVEYKIGDLEENLEEVCFALVHKKDEKGSLLIIKIEGAKVLVEKDRKHEDDYPLEDSSFQSYGRIIDLKIGDYKVHIVRNDWSRSSERIEKRIIKDLGKSWIEVDEARDIRVDSRTVGKKEILLGRFFNERSLSSDQRESIQRYMSRQGELMRMKGTRGFRFKEEEWQDRLTRVNKQFNLGLDDRGIQELVGRLGIEHKRGEIWRDQDGGYTVAASEIKILGNIGMGTDWESEMDLGRDFGELALFQEPDGSIKGISIHPKQVIMTILGRKSVDISDKFYRIRKHHRLVGDGHDIRVSNNQGEIKLEVKEWSGKKRWRVVEMMRDEEPNNIEEVGRVSDGPDKESSSLESRGPNERETQPSSTGVPPAGQPSGPGASQLPTSTPPQPPPTSVKPEVPGGGVGEDGTKMESRASTEDESEAEFKLKWIETMKNAGEREIPLDKFFKGKGYTREEEKGIRKMMRVYGKRVRGNGLIRVGYQEGLQNYLLETTLITDNINVTERELDALEKLLQCEYLRGKVWSVLDDETKKTVVASDIKFAGRGPGADFEFGSEGLGVNTFQLALLVDREGNLLVNSSSSKSFMSNKFEYLESGEEIFAGDFSIRAKVIDGEIQLEGRRLSDQDWHVIEMATDKVSDAQEGEGVIETPSSAVPSSGAGGEGSNQPPTPPPAPAWPEDSKGDGGGADGQNLESGVSVEGSNAPEEVELTEVIDGRTIPLRKWLEGSSSHPKALSESLSDDQKIGLEKLLNSAGQEARLETKGLRADHTFGQTFEKGLGRLKITLTEGQKKSFEKRLENERKLGVLSRKYEVPIHDMLLLGPDHEIVDLPVRGFRQGEYRSNFEELAVWVIDGQVQVCNIGDQNVLMDGKYIGVFEEGEVSVVKQSSNLAISSLSCSIKLEGDELVVTDEIEDREISRASIGESRDLESSAPMESGATPAPTGAPSDASSGDSQPPTSPPPSAEPGVPERDDQSHTDTTMESSTKVRAEKERELPPLPKYTKDDEGRENLPDGKVNLGWFFDGENAPGKNLVEHREEIEAIVREELVPSIKFDKKDVSFKLKMKAISGVSRDQISKLYWQSYMNSDKHYVRAFVMSDKETDRVPLEAMLSIGGKGNGNNLEEGNDNMSGVIVYFDDGKFKLFNQSVKCKVDGEKPEYAEINEYSVDSVIELGDVSFRVSQEEGRAVLRDSKTNEVLSQVKMIGGSLEGDSDGGSDLGEGSPSATPTTGSGGGGGDQPPTSPPSSAEPGAPEGDDDVSGPTLDSETPVEDAVAPERETKGDGRTIDIDWFVVKLKENGTSLDQDQIDSLTKLVNQAGELARLGAGDDYMAELEDALGQINLTLDDDMRSLIQYRLNVERDLAEAWRDPRNDYYVNGADISQVKIISEPGFGGEVEVNYIASQVSNYSLGVFSKDGELFVVKIAPCTARLGRDELAFGEVTPIADRDVVKVKTENLMMCIDQETNELVVVNDATGDQVTSVNMGEGMEPESPEADGIKLPFKLGMDSKLGGGKEVKPGEELESGLNSEWDEAEKNAGDGVMPLDKFFEDKGYNEEQRKEMRVAMEIYGKNLRTNGLIGHEFDSSEAKLQIDYSAEVHSIDLSEEDLKNYERMLEREYTRGKLWNLLDDETKKTVKASDIKIVGGEGSYADWELMGEKDDEGTDYLALTRNEEFTLVIGLLPETEINNYLAETSRNLLEGEFSPIGSSDEIKVGNTRVLAEWENEGIQLQTRIVLGDLQGYWGLVEMNRDKASEAQEGEGAKGTVLERLKEEIDNGGENLTNAGEGEIAMDWFFEGKSLSEPQQTELRKYVKMKAKLMRANGIANTDFVADAEELQISMEVQEMGVELNDKAKLDLKQIFHREHKKGKIWSEISGPLIAGRTASDIKMVGSGAWSDFQAGKARDGVMWNHLALIVSADGHLLGTSKGLGEVSLESAPPAGMTMDMDSDTPLRVERVDIITMGERQIQVELVDGEMKLRLNKYEKSIGRDDWREVGMNTDKVREPQEGEGATGTVLDGAEAVASGEVEDTGVEAGVIKATGTREESAEVGLLDELTKKIEGREEDMKNAGERKMPIDKICEGKFMIGGLKEEIQTLVDMQAKLLRADGIARSSFGQGFSDRSEVVDKLINQLDKNYFSSDLTTEDRKTLYNMFEREHKKGKLWNSLPNKNVTASQIEFVGTEKFGGVEWVLSKELNHRDNIYLAVVSTSDGLYVTTKNLEIGTIKKSPKLGENKTEAEDHFIKFESGNVLEIGFIDIKMEEVDGVFQFKSKNSVGLDDSWKEVSRVEGPLKVKEDVPAKEAELESVEEWSIGRNAENRVVLEAQEISNKHAVIEYRPDGTYVLKDLGSKNGTIVQSENEESGVGVGNEGRVLLDGDFINMGTGGALMKFQIKEDGSGVLVDFSDENKEIREIVPKIFEERREAERVAGDDEIAMDWFFEGKDYTRAQRTEIRAMMNEAGQEIRQLGIMGVELKDREVASRIGENLSFQVETAPLVDKLQHEYQKGQFLKEIIESNVSGAKEIKASDILVIGPSLGADFEAGIDTDINILAVNIDGKVYTYTTESDQFLMQIEPDGRTYKLETPQMVLPESEIDLGSTMVQVRQKNGEVKVRSSDAGRLGSGEVEQIKDMKKVISLDEFFEEHSWMKLTFDQERELQKVINSIGRDMHNKRYFNKEDEMLGLLEQEMEKNVDKTNFHISSAMGDVIKDRMVLEYRKSELWQKLPEKRRKEVSIDDIVILSGEKDLGSFGGQILGSKVSLAVYSFEGKLYVAEIGHDNCKVKVGSKKVPKNKFRPIQRGSKLHIDYLYEHNVTLDVDGNELVVRKETTNRMEPDAGVISRTKIGKETRTRMESAVAKEKEPKQKWQVPLREITRSLKLGKRDLFALAAHGVVEIVPTGPVKSAASLLLSVGLMTANLTPVVQRGLKGINKRYTKGDKKNFRGVVEAVVAQAAESSPIAKGLMALDEEKITTIEAGTALLSGLIAGVAPMVIGSASAGFTPPGVGATAKWFCTRFASRLIPRVLNIGAGVMVTKIGGRAIDSEATREWMEISTSMASTTLTVMAGMSVALGAGESVADRITWNQVNSEDGGQASTVTATMTGAGDDQGEVTPIVAGVTPAQADEVPAEAEVIPSEVAQAESPEVEVPTEMAVAQEASVTLEEPTPTIEPIVSSDSHGSFIDYDADGEHDIEDRYLPTQTPTNTSMPATATLESATVAPPTATAEPSNTPIIPTYTPSSTVPPVTTAPTTVVESATSEPVVDPVVELDTPNSSSAFPHPSSQVDDQQAPAVDAPIVETPVAEEPVAEAPPVEETAPVAEPEPEPEPVQPEVIVPVGEAVFGNDQPHVVEWGGRYFIDRDGDGAYNPDGDVLLKVEPEVAIDGSLEKIEYEDGSFWKAQGVGIGDDIGITPEGKTLIMHDGSIAGNLQLALHEAHPDWSPQEVGRVAYLNHQVDANNHTLIENMLPNGEIAEGVEDQGVWKEDADGNEVGVLPDGKELVMGPEGGAHGLVHNDIRWYAPDLSPNEVGEVSHVILSNHPELNVKVDHDDNYMNSLIEKAGIETDDQEIYIQQAIIDAKMEISFRRVLMDLDNRHSEWSIPQSRLVEISKDIRNSYFWYPDVFSQFFQVPIGYDSLQWHFKSGGYNVEEIIVKYLLDNNIIDENDDTK